MLVGSVLDSVGLMYSIVALQIVDTLPGAFISNQFDFEGAVPRLGEEVVVVFDLGSDIGDSFGVGETVGITNTGPAGLCGGGFWANRT